METNNQRVSIKSKSQSSSQPDQKTSDVFYVAVKIKKLWAKTTSESPPVDVFSQYIIVQTPIKIWPPKSLLCEGFCCCFFCYLLTLPPWEIMSSIFFLSLMSLCLISRETTIIPQVLKSHGRTSRFKFPAFFPIHVFTIIPQLLNARTESYWKDNLNLKHNGNGTHRRKKQNCSFFFSPFGCGRRQFNKRGGEITGAFPMTN